MTVTKTGIFNNVSDAEYHAMTDHLSSTGVRKLIPPSTPAHFDDWVKNPQPPSDAFDLGHVVHRLVLGKGADYFPMDPKVHGLKKDGTVADSPAATATWKAAAAEARADGKTPIHVDDLATAEKMRSSVFATPDAAALFKTGEPEVSIFATDPTTGVKLRARFDWLDGHTAVDLKTAANGAPDEFDRDAAKFGYYVQEMFYRHVAECAGWPIDAFKFVVVEKRGPNLTTVHEWDDVARSIGKRLVRQAIDLYARCLEADDWPGYAPGTHVMGLPMWMLDEVLGMAS